MEICAAKKQKKDKIIGFFIVFGIKTSPFSKLFSIKKAQNHWLAPRFFERIFNVRPRVISVTVSNYVLNIIIMWRNVAQIVENF
jgi:hypothetical protein